MSQGRQQPTGGREEAVATLAGGCFWCTEAVVEQLRGVEGVVSGYTGGHTSQPSYQQVCAGTTGHAEAVQITFNSQSISYRELLEVFFSTHDPTTLNRQGPDSGTQYRSAIFYHDAEQQAVAQELISGLSREGVWARPIVTEVTAFTTFYPAEGYHQEYFRSNQGQPYCQVIIEPKVAKFRQKYLARLKEKVATSPGT